LLTQVILNAPLDYTGGPIDSRIWSIERRHFQ